MSDQPPNPDLIRKYFDQSATDTELTELAQRLREPAAVAAFVAASRLESWLEAAFAAEAPDRPVAPAPLTAFGSQARQRKAPHRARLSWPGKLGLAVAFLLAIGLGFLALGPAGPPPTQPWAALPTAPGRQVAPVRADPPHSDAMPVPAAMAVFGLVTGNTVK